MVLGFSAYRDHIVSHFASAVGNRFVSMLGAIAATTLSCVLLSACGDSGERSVAGVTAPTEHSTPVEAQKEAPRKIALVMKTLTNPFFIEMEKGARRAEKEFGIELSVKTASQETSIEQQIQIVEEAIAARVDAIVIAPGDSVRLVPVLKKAQDAGIKVVNIDNALSTQALEAEHAQPIPFISVDNERAAYEATEAVVKDIRRPTTAAIIEGIRSAENAQQRMRGAEKAFAENPSIRVAARETANWKIDEAHEVAKQILSAHPDVGLIFCANDMMALGTLRYLDESGHRNVTVIGYDALDEARDAVRAGRLAITVDQKAAEQGYQGVATAVHMLDGEVVPSHIQVDAALVTASNLP